MKMDIIYFTDEVWADIEGYEGLYQVSTKGNVRNSRTGKILKGRPDKDGYLQVALRKDGKAKEHMIHRLVAEAFIPNPENKPTVDHINRVHVTNTADNLRWATREEQTHNSSVHDKKKPVVAYCNGNRFVYPSRNKCAKELNLNKGAILMCLTGKQKTHKGYRFEYLESSEILND